MLSREDIVEFQGLWKERFHEDLSYEKATEEARSLLGLLKAVYRPITSVQLDNLNKSSIG